MPSMTMEERKGWVARGHKDPVVAYRQHAANAARRGIEFRMTFDQWWEVWQPHYALRGSGAGRLVMCRTADAGAYEVGNVRIDTNEANAREFSEVFRARNVNARRLPTARGRESLIHQAPDNWLRRRKFACDPYVEPEDEESELY